MQFWEHVQYGDLILFNSSLPMTGLNETIEWEGFHHVAMVVDRDHQFVQVFDAVTRGVRIVTWESIRKYCGTYKTRERKEVWPRVWWRKVNFERTPENMAILHKLSEETLGRTYELSEPKLLKRFSSFKEINQKKAASKMELPKLTGTISLPHSDIEALGEEHGGYDGSLVREDRTFFCSELVSKAFKLMSIIENNDKSCS